MIRPHRGNDKVQDGTLQEMRQGKVGGGASLQRAGRGQASREEKERERKKLRYKKQILLFM